jgi:hypothetical protein
MPRNKLKFPPDNEIKALIAKAKRFFARFHYPSYLADDFAQFYIIKISEGRKANIDNLLVDFIRHEFGRTVSEFGKLKSASMLKRPDINLDWIASDDEKEIDSLPENFNYKEKWIVERLNEGYFYKEIGESLNISESRVCQMLKDMRMKAEV